MHTTTDRGDISGMMIGIGMACGLAGILGAGAVYERRARRRGKAKLPFGRMVDVGDCRLHVTERGASGPTVVLLHGAGDCSYSWLHIMKELSAFARVVSYDRPGLGSSEPGPAPDAAHSVEELHALLDKLGIDGPVVLVGHSLGGLLARLYAAAHPERIAGLVFLDSTHESLLRDRKFKQGFAALGVLLKLLRALSPFGVPRLAGNRFGALPMFSEEGPHYRRQLSPEEYEAWTSVLYRNFAGTAAAGEFRAAFPLLAAADARLETAKAAADGPVYGDLPIAVVNNPGYGEAWTAMQRELASRSTNSFYRLSDRRGHSVQMPRPEYVVEAVRFVCERGAL
ncbi:alpha/beta hydrolase [Paenibacillus sp. TRM 82003]|nr:alpha/beta hydrolase [Paenibacillus sp. TRM 82003]